MLSRKFSLPSAAVAPLALFLLLLAPVPALAAGNLAEVRASGVLRLLSFPDQESTFMRVDVERGLGHYQGIDYELIRGFADQLGVRLEVVPARSSFGDLLPMLLAGDGDVVGSSLSITSERRTRVDFSIPYFALKTVVIARKGAGWTDTADLAGKTGATVQGSSHHEILRKIPGVRILFVDFARWNLDAIAEGQADFAVLDEPMTWDLLQLYPSLAVAFELPETDTYGFAVRPGSDLRASLDRYLTEVRDSGRLDEIVKKHMGTDASSGLSKASR
jgi:ABC-type amino acid transport substrate-binding protein